MELDGKVALVTGAGSGLGKAAALKLAGAGARVGVLSRTARRTRPHGCGNQCRGRESAFAGRRHLRCRTNQASCLGLVEAYGRLDVVFANAGINGVWAPIDEIEPDEWDRTD